MRLDALADRDELVHQLLVDVQPAGGVDDQHVLAVRLRLAERPLGDVDRVAVGALAVDGRAGLPADGLELLDGGGALQVAGGERDRLPVLGEELGELRAGGRLAGALEAGHQDHGRPRGGEGEVARGAAHQARELLVDDLDDLLAGVEGLEHAGAEQRSLTCVVNCLTTLKLTSASSSARRISRIAGRRRPR